MVIVKTSTEIAHNISVLFFIYANVERLHWTASSR
jgi:hypothetical protein